MASQPMRREGREGFALATTLLIILVLGIIAVGATWLASSESKITTAESVHVRALYSADAGTESAINFIRLADYPPPHFDEVRTVRSQAATALDSTQSFSYDCRLRGLVRKVGWGTEDYADFEYDVAANGVTGAQGRSSVQVVAARLFRMGY